MSQASNLLYSWSYEDTKDRSPVWYIIALAVWIGLVVWWFISRQYGMSIIVMLAWGVYYFLENNSEDRVEVRITELGINVQWNFYDYSKISGYALVYQWESAVYLRLIMKKRGITTLNIGLSNTDAAQINAILPSYIEENERQEITLSEKITQYLKL